MPPMLCSRCWLPWRTAVLLPPDGTSIELRRSRAGARPARPHADLDNAAHQHAVPEFFVTKKTETRSPLRFTRVAETAATLDFPSKPVKLLGTAQHGERSHSWCVRDSLRRSGKPACAMAWSRRRPPSHPSSSGTPSRTESRCHKGKDALYNQSFEVLLRRVKVLHDAVLTLVPVIDSELPGLFLHHELELWVKAGLPTVAALAAATMYQSGSW